jgi:hypothetical protein
MTKIPLFVSAEVKVKMDPEGIPPVKECLGQSVYQIKAEVINF